MESNAHADYVGISATAVNTVGNRRRNILRRVVLESPYSGNVLRNVEYARACVRDCLKRGEAPIASHLLFTQVLNDEDPAERKLGIEAGHAWIASATAVVVYIDYGISDGMQEGINRARRHQTPVEFRSILSKDRGEHHL
jgi:hypothetical protein